MTTKRSPGRRRWAAVVKYLTEVMENRNLKLPMRMRAAMRLSDILLAREQRDILELKAAARKAEAPGETAKAEQQDTPGDTQAGTDLDAKVAAIFGPLVSRGKDASAPR